MIQLKDGYEMKKLTILFFNLPLYSSNIDSNGEKFYLSPKSKRNNRYQQHRHVSIRLNVGHRTFRVGILLHVIYMEVGARGEIPVKFTGFHWAVEIWPDIPLKFPTKGRGGECTAKTSGPTTLMKQTPYQ